MSEEQSKEDYLVGGLFLAIVVCISSIYALYASKSLSFLWMLLLVSLLSFYLFYGKRKQMEIGEKDE